MKFYETHYEEYISENNRVNLHTKLDKIYSNVECYKNIPLENI